jgi:cysteine dioxygenase
VIPREAISQLSTTLARLHDGDAAAEVVRWLRASLPAIASAAAPASRDEDRGYSRSLIYKDARFEVLAMHWEAGCVTPIHDHGGSRCWFSVAKGTIGVENYRRYGRAGAEGHAEIGLEGREELGTGGIDYRGDDLHLHRCLSRNGPALTLHVYARPLQAYLEFDERTRSCARTTATYDALSIG